MMRIDLQRYNGLSVELDSEDARHAVRDKGDQGETKKRLTIRNGEKQVRDCSVVLDRLEYYFLKEWIPSPTGFERKALKWDVGVECPEGKTGLSVESSEALEVARLFRFPNPHFVISYCDGFTGRTHQLAGVYKLRLRIEGKIIDGGKLMDILPVIYEVQLDYLSALDLDIRILSGQVHKP